MIIKRLLRCLSFKMKTITSRRSPADWGKVHLTKKKKRRQVKRIAIPWSFSRILMTMMKMKMIVWKTKTTIIVSLDLVVYLQLLTGFPLVVPLMKKRISCLKLRTVKYPTRNFKCTKSIKVMRKRKTKRNQQKNEINRRSRKKKKNKRIF